MAEVVVDRAVDCGLLLQGLELSESRHRPLPAFKVGDASFQPGCSASVRSPDVPDFRAHSSPLDTAAADL